MKTRSGKGVTKGLVEEGRSAKQKFAAKKRGRERASEKVGVRAFDAGTGSP